MLGQKVLPNRISSNLMVFLHLPQKSNIPLASKYVDSLTMFFLMKVSRNVLSLPSFRVNLAALAIFVNEYVKIVVHFDA